MEGINLPEFLNTEEKYNKLIHDIDTLDKFEEVYLKLLSDDNLEMSAILTLMKIIECDVILINKLTEASTLIEMTESFIRYMMLKEPISSNKNDNKEEVEKKKSRKSIKDISKKQNKIPKEDTKKEKKMKPSVEKEGVIECDCDC